MQATETKHKYSRSWTSQKQIIKQLCLQKRSLKLSMGKTLKIDKANCKKGVHKVTRYE